MTVILASILAVLYIIGVIICAFNNPGQPLHRHIISLIVYCILIPLPVIVGAISLAEFIISVIIKVRKRIRHEI